MKIYTRTGDDGSTGLFGGARVAKDAPRIEAYGTVDELNAMLGVARAALGAGDAVAPLDAVLARLQAELFVLGSELATAPGTLPPAPSGALGAGHIAALEGEMDGYDAELAPLRNFILPGGSAASAALHVARTVCRRAERAALTLSRREPVRAEVLVYLNRLSDHLFELARLVNHRANVADVPWNPRG